MSNPVRDAGGNVIPHDDPTIDRASGFIRHINPDHHIVVDENIGGRRLGSNAFSASSGDPHYGLSGDIEQDLIAAGRANTAQVPSGFGAVRLQVGKLRDLGLSVGADPVEENAFHGQAWGVRSTKRSKIYALVDTWLVPIPGVAIR
jgi:hypothetical protein